MVRDEEDAEEEGEEEEDEKEEVRGRIWNCPLREKSAVLGRKETLDKKPGVNHS